MGCGSDSVVRARGLGGRLAELCSGGASVWRLSSREVPVMATVRRPAMGSLVVAVLMLCTSSIVHAVGVAKSVNVSVRAKWEGTSLLLEAGLVSV